VGIIKEFKEFAVKGNAIEMAIGIVLGLAFTKVINSLVNDIIMPPLGLLVGPINFDALGIVIKKNNPDVVISYGKFVGTIINFVLISAALFFVVKALTTLMKKKPAPPNTKLCPECQMNIPINAKKCAHCTSTVAK
jgi:large conductance mechanosensitive channel